MNNHSIEISAAFFFIAAVLHTFACSYFKKISARFNSKTFLSIFFHFMGEVEIAFGFWALLFLLLSMAWVGPSLVIENLQKLSFTEPLFVFVVLCIAATDPILLFARDFIFGLSKIVPIQKKEVVVYFLCLSLGSLLGSLITEPAAMTVVALILKEYFFTEKVSKNFKYLTLAVLFTNISIGGVLTSFGAPPVIMVAEKWGWNSSFMIRHFGYKAVLATSCNALFATALCYKSLKAISFSSHRSKIKIKIPFWLQFLHLFFLFSVVAMAHQFFGFLMVFLCFLGLFKVTKKYNHSLKIRDGLLVALFLSGLIVLGSHQSWWIQSVLKNLSHTSLFFSVSALTAITDNAALTFLGSQIEGIDFAFQFALVSGAVIAGGLTVIANAPNPIGYSILQERFGIEGIESLKLFLFAVPPTLISMIFFLLLPA